MPVIVTYWIDLGTVCLSQGMLAALVAFSWGRAGVLVLGPALFFGLGSYAVALTFQYGGGFVLGISIGVAAACLLTVPIAATTLGRSGGLTAFAGATLVLGLVCERAASKWYSFTNGSNGILIPRRPTFGLDLLFSSAGPDPRSLAYLLIVTAMVSVVLMALVYLDKSYLGIALILCRDAPDTIARAGVSVACLRVAVATAVAVGAAIAGGLYAPAASIVSPELFGVAVSMQTLAWVVIGGMRPLGAFVAACALRVMEAELGSSFSDWYLLGTAVVLIVGVLRESLEVTGSGSKEIYESM
jgi:branched-chain amino acid transport system permease protein